MDREEQCRRLQGMPAAMRSLPQWLVWRLETYEGDTKPRKVPYYATTGRKRRGGQGDATDRKNLATFEFALERLRVGAYDGLGFAFLPGDGLIGIDLDGQVDPDTGEVSERCRSIVAACASYTEWSPSGKGVHIIVSGETKTFKDNSIGVEVFCGAQFFTCTGQHWEDTPADVAPIEAGVLRRLEKTVNTAKEASKAKRNPAAAANIVPLSNDFARVNAMALATLDQWVPALLPQAKRAGSGWRVTSKSLGRDLQEDLSFHRDGIQDYGTEKGMTAIDVVVEFGGKSPKEALRWLADAIGVRLEKSGGGKASRSAARGREGAETPSTGSADGAEDTGGAADGGAQDPKLVRWASKLLPTNDGGVKDCRENVFYMLTEHPELKGLVGFNEFAYQVVKLRDPPWASTPGEWTPHDDYELGLWLSQQTKFRLVVKAEGTLVAGIAMAAYRRRFHPVRQYLQGLKWDGIERLDHWVHECLKSADTTYNKMVGRWFLLGMANRVINPGCQMDNMVILEGSQGRRKSTALRILAGEWFADTPIKVGEKDAMLNLAGVWLYEIAELDSFNRAEVTAVKQYVSSREDRVREPYARRPTTRKRECVLGGTTNQYEYFKDPTGSRRFWPIAVADDIDLEKLAAWRDQLFAEAMAALAKGERYYPTRDEAKEFIEPEQDAREIGDPWFERISIWLDAEAQVTSHSFTSGQILIGALHVPVDKIDGGRAMATRVGTCMHKLGWGKERDDKGARLWRYYRPGWSKKGEIRPESTGVPATAAADSDNGELHEF